MKDNIIWYVECEDLSCAWTKKEDAIKYFENIAKECSWEYNLIGDAEIAEPDDYLIYLCYYNDEEPFIVKILPVFFNQKPFR